MAGTKGLENRAFETDSASQGMSTNVSGIVLALLLIVSSTVSAGAENRSSREIQRLATAVRAADYAGDRKQLRLAISAITPLLDEGAVAAEAHYWRGFASWRSAIAGFNDRIARSEIEADLLAGAADFRRAEALRSNFTEAAIGAAGCEIGLISVYERGSQEERAHAQNARSMLNELKVAAPENPRLAWLLGGAVWNTPPSTPASRARALEIYMRGLAAARREKGTDRTFPGWGEAELLVSIAWSKLHDTPPDVEGAQTHVQAALHIVPQWRYARTILLPQIEERRAASLPAAESTSPAPIDADVELAAIQRLRDKDVDASKRKDVAALATLFTDDAVAMLPGQPPQQQSQRTAAMARVARDMKHLEVTSYEERFEETQLLRDLNGNLFAIEWGTIQGSTLDTAAGDRALAQTSYNVLRVLKKLPGGEWRIHRTIYNER